MIIKLNIPHQKTIHYSDREFVSRFLGMHIVYEPVGESKIVYRAVEAHIHREVNESFLRDVTELIDRCRRSKGELELEHEILLFIYFYLTSVVPESILPE